MTSLCRDYGTTRGYPNESSYSYIKVDFYNNIATYLSEVSNTNVKSLEDIVQYNIDNVGSEGGTPGIQPAFGSGQDGFIASLDSKGIQNETYWQALAFCQRTTREDGIDAALHNGGDQLDALLMYLCQDVASCIKLVQILLTVDPTMLKINRASLLLPELKGAVTVSTYLLCTIKQTTKTTVA